MRKISCLLILFLLCFHTCVHAKSVILILGDSLSTAYGLERNDGWVELLKKRLDEHQLQYTVVNASMAGATTANGLATLSKLLANHQPVLTIIELGGNDILLGIQINIIKKNLIRLIALCHEKNSRVILLAIRPPPNYGKAFIEALSDMYQQLSEKVMVVPLYSDNFLEDIKLLQPDQIHPTKEGQFVILNRIWPDIFSVLMAVPGRIKGN